LPQAEDLYARVLQSDERHFGAVHGLGLIRLQQGRFADALNLFRRAAKIDRNSAEAQHHLGVALTATARPADAIERFEKALALRPDFAEAHDGLGHALQWLGRIEAAILHHERAIAIKPDYAEAYNNLGNALQRLGRGDKAIAFYRKALALRPDYAEASINLADALGALGHHEQALAHYRQALATRPRNAELHNAIGNTLHLLGQSEEAIAHYETAIEVDAEHAEAHNNLGIALRTLGKLDEACRAFERAIALDPARPAFYWNAAGSRRFTTADPHFAAMRKLAQNPQALRADEQIDLQFALAKAFSDVGDPQQSFQHLAQGNALKRGQIAYDEAAALGKLDRIRAVFSRDLLRGKAGLGDPSPLPVFVVGLPRSGTTLIEQILASHPWVFGAGELREFARLAGNLSGADGTAFPEAVPGLAVGTLSDLGREYRSTLQNLAPPAHRIVDKMPGNFVFVGLIHLALPNARILHACRDLRDTALSCFSLLFKTADYTYDLAELGRYCRAYERLMGHWRDLLPPGVMLDVQYEDLVADLDGQARRMVAHLGLDWDKACLGFYRTQRPVRTASAVQVRQPIYPGSVGRWRRYEAQLQPLLEALAS
jgi:tetratricopeptide (TPR) repeat protein